MSESGLIYRVALAASDNRIVVEEDWDLDTPGCPMIQNPWGAPVHSRRVIRQVILTALEFKASNACGFDLRGIGE